MQDHRVAAIGIYKPVLGAPPQPGDGRARQPLAQIHRHGAAQVGAVQNDARYLLPIKDRAQTADGGFDFGKFGHGGVI